MIIKVTSEQGKRWSDGKAIKKSSASEASPLDLQAERDQTIIGFGGCFNEIGAKALFELDKSERQEVLEELFGADACDFGFCRTPMGASDFALSWYSYNDNEHDFSMDHFSIERDKEYLLPYIKEAKKLRGELKLFASPWSPPAWLKEKNRYNGSRLRQEKEVFEAYAHYFSKYLSAYKSEGFDIKQVHVQNEPNSDQKFPSCIWTGAEMRDFIKDYLGPKLEAEGHLNDTEIWAGTIEKGTHHGWAIGPWKDFQYKDWTHTILSDKAARKYIKGVGYQWDGKGSVQRTHTAFPEVPIMQTESECGNGENSWDYAFYTFELMWQYFNNGCSAYAYWNMILTPGGESTWGWPQNSMITIDSGLEKGKRITYNPEFYLMKHLSNSVKPGARFIKQRGEAAAFSLAFENPDKSIAIIAVNPFDIDQDLSFNSAGEGETMTVPSRSFVSYIKKV